LLAFFLTTQPKKLSMVLEVMVAAERLPALYWPTDS
jgi:hypothetical protein